MQHSNRSMIEQVQNKTTPLERTSIWRSIDRSSTIVLCVQIGSQSAQRPAPPVLCRGKPAEHRPRGSNNDDDLPIKTTRQVPIDVVVRISLTTDNRARNTTIKSRKADTATDDAGKNKSLEVGEIWGKMRYDLYYSSHVISTKISWTKYSIRLIILVDRIHPHGRSSKRAGIQQNNDVG